jgi:hypothetical protein
MYLFITLNKFIGLSDFATYFFLFFAGFVDVKAACCGIGELNAELPCLPSANICTNRQDHIFWDSVHPTEAVTRIIVDRLYNGPSQYTSPVSMKELLHVSIAKSPSPITFFILLSLLVTCYQTQTN